MTGLCAAVLVVLFPSLAEPDTPAIICTPVLKETQKTKKRKLIFTKQKGVGEKIYELHCRPRCRPTHVGMPIPLSTAYSEIPLLVP